LIVGKSDGARKVKSEIGNERKRRSTKETSGEACQGIAGREARQQVTRQKQYGALLAASRRVEKLEAPVERAIP